METAMTPRSARRLQERPPLPVEPQRRIAIKREVHEFVVNAGAAAFARAFREAMVDPEERFGPIRVRRPADRLGQEFEVGERFQGCFGLRDLAGRRLGAVLDTAPLRWLVRLVEDGLLSDYGEVREIVLDPAPGEPYKLRYAYLRGTPIAGSSTFLVEPLPDGRCRVVQVFEYQEVGAFALATFQRIGLKLHDRVVHHQVCTAARRAGADVLHETIPAAYAA